MILHFPQLAFLSIPFPLAIPHWGNFGVLPIQNVEKAKRRLWKKFMNAIAIN